MACASDGRAHVGRRTARIPDCWVEKPGAIWPRGLGARPGPDRGRARLTLEEKANPRSTGLSAFQLRISGTPVDCWPWKARPQVTADEGETSRPGRRGNGLLPGTCTFR